MIILFGRFFYILVWLFLIINLFYPYPAPANLLATISLIALVFIHGLQVFLLNVTLTQQEKQQDKFKILRLFLFGVVETLSWNKQKMPNSNNN